MLVVISKDALMSLMQQIAMASHELTDTSGERVTLSTIDDRHLRSAALQALATATGEVVWPGDQALSIKRPKRQVGVVNFEE